MTHGPLESLAQAQVGSRRWWLHRTAAAGLSAATAGMGWAQGAPAVHKAPAARRIISLGGAVTEMVYALGAQASLVATDTTSLYPPAANATPKVGYLRQLSAEGLLALQPDAVIGPGEVGPAVVLEQLRAAGVRVALVPSTHNWAEVLAKLQLVSQITGLHAQGSALARQLEADWQAAQAEVARAPRRPRALFIMSHSGTPLVAGKGTAAHALLELAGAHNVVQQFSGYRALTAEALAAAAPEVIVNSTQGIEALGGVDAFWRRPELALTPAFRRRALATMEASHLLGFGPRLPSAVRGLHTLMQQQVA